MIKKFFLGCYSLYVLVLFFLTAPIALVFYILCSPLLDRQRMLSIYAFNRAWFRVWSTLCFIRITVQHADILDSKSTYVLVGNHTNLLDIPLCAGFIYHYFKPLIKKEILKIPVVGWLFGMTSIAVDRSSSESRKEAVNIMINALKQGTSLFLFPEGTRNRTSEPLKSFHDGAFKIAIATGVPIVPIVFKGLKSLQPVDTFFVSPGHVTLKFLEPVPTTGLTELDVEQLKTKVFDIMYKELQ